MSFNYKGEAELGWVAKTDAVDLKMRQGKGIPTFCG